MPTQLLERKGEPPEGHVLGSSCPYLGLRSFQRDERHLFFGREELEDELLNRLESNRFLAVVGPSGCGKSSLVKAGLLGRLESGDLRQAGQSWMITEMRPGHVPFARLAAALLDDSALGPAYSGDPTALGRIEALIRTSEDGLLEFLNLYHAAERRPLLLLVDQFEEIFTFEDRADPGDMAKFVALLVKTAKASEAQIYTTITMRSDFLGDCSRYTELADILNRSQFLTPRMTREKCAKAIQKPAELFGAKIDEEVVNLLLNDTWRERDQLSVLQHALMRMWIKAGGPPPESPLNVRKRLHLHKRHYDDVGGAVGALNQHAEELYESLREARPENAHLTETLFKRLTGGSRERTDTRRTVSIEEVATVAGTSSDAIIPIVEKFRLPQNSFLTPLRGELTADTIIDIIHESIIRKWSRLDELTKDEARASRLYGSLALRSFQHREGKADLYHEADLVWCDEQQWSKPTFRAWARRYVYDRQNPEQELDFVAGFIALSELQLQKQKSGARRERKRREIAAKQEQERLQNERNVKQLRRSLVRLVAACVSLSLIVVAAALFIFSKFGDASAQVKTAELRKQVAAANEARLAASHAELVAENGRHFAEASLANMRADLTAEQKKAAKYNLQWLRASTQATKAQSELVTAIAAKKRAETFLSAAVGFKNRSSMGVQIAQKAQRKAEDSLAAEQQKRHVAELARDSALHETSDAEGKLTAARNDLVTAEKARADAEQKFADAERTLAAAQSAVTDAQTRQAAAETGMNDAKGRLTSLQAQYTDLLEKYNDAHDANLNQVSLDGSLVLSLDVKGGGIQVVDASQKKSQTVRAPNSASIVTATAIREDGKYYAIGYTASGNSAANARAQTEQTRLYESILVVGKPFVNASAARKNLRSPARQIVFSKHGVRVLVLLDDGGVLFYDIGNAGKDRELERPSNPDPIVFVGFGSESGDKYIFKRKNGDTTLLKQQ
jgi:energy-coupling factor transporter ATP-binding protein EcfA2